MATKKKVVQTLVAPKEVTLRDVLGECLNLAEDERAKENVRRQEAYDNECARLEKIVEEASRTIRFTCRHTQVLNLTDPRVSLARMHTANHGVAIYDVVRCPVCNPGYQEVQIQIEEEVK